LKKEGREEAIPCILEPQEDEKISRRNGSFLFQPVIVILTIHHMPKGSGYFLHKSSTIENI
jgi:hypothetical protein